MTGSDGRTYEIALTQRTIAYTLRRSDRAKRIQLRYRHGEGFEVVLPRKMALREVEPFLRASEGWIARVLARFAARPVVQPAAPALVDGDQLPYLGRTLPLRVTSGRQATVQLRDDALHVSLPPDGPATAPTLVEAWYRFQAKHVLTERAMHHANTLGVTFGRVTIKDTRSRWGSCSAKGNLNFSWRLLLAPPVVMDYVVAHEVAHLRELNHSPRFWNTVKTLCPDYETHRRWLKAHGNALASWPGGCTDSRVR